MNPAPVRPTEAGCPRFRPPRRGTWDTSALNRPSFIGSKAPSAFLSFLRHPSCVTLALMGSKDKGKKEAKKAPKPKPKPEPGRRREGFTPTPPK
jgi:hypothetical protein